MSRRELRLVVVCPSCEEFLAERAEAKAEGERMRYSAITERGAEGFGAYVPDLPGCVAAGESKEEVLSSIREAVFERGARGGRSRIDRRGDEPPMFHSIW